MFRIILILWMVIIIGSCINEPKEPTLNKEGPFSYVYVNPRKVILKLQDCGINLPTQETVEALNCPEKTYVIEQGVVMEHPFNYKFEDDGDVVVYYGRAAYEIDSPYKKSVRPKPVTIKSKKCKCGFYHPISYVGCPMESAKD